MIAQCLRRSRDERGFGPIGLFHPRRILEVALRRSPVFLRALLLWAAVAVAASVATTVYLNRLQDSVEAAAFERTDASAELAEQAMLRILDEIRGVHRLLVVWQRLSDASAFAGTAEVEAALRDIASAAELGILQISIVGRDGHVAWGAAPGATGTYLGDREHIRVHLDGSQEGIYLGRPVVGRSTGRWSIQASQALYHADGRLAGVALVSVDPVALSRMLGRPGTDDGELVVVRRLTDGALLARSRNTAAHLDRPPVPDHPVVVAARARPRGHLRYATTPDGREVLASYRVPPGIPVSVTALHDTATEMAEFRRVQQAVLAALAAALIAGLLGAWAWAWDRELRTVLKAEAKLDPLTGLLNRRSLQAEADRAIEAARRKGRSLGVLLFDLDHFKQINDVNGHASGDQVLRDVAGVLGAAVRRDDLVCRWGGEEMLVLLRDCGPETIMARADTLRQAVADLYRGRHGPVPEVTVSVGAACIPAHGQTLQDAVRCADSALYDAKRGGRNQVAVYGLART